MDNQDTRSKLPGILCAAAVLIAIVLLLHGGGRYYFGGAETDLVAQFYPWRVFIKRWFDRGVIPLWDPHVFSGYPVLETQQMLALNPIRLLSTIFVSARLSLLVEAAGYTLVAAAGTWFGLRRFVQCSSAAALVGTVTWVFGGLFTIRIGAGHFTVLAGICWWPLAMALSYHISQIALKSSDAGLFTPIIEPLRNKRWRLAILLLALVNAMVILAGGPQYVVYLFYIELLVILVAASNRMQAVIGNGIAWALALALSAPQWLPTLWYLPFTGRASGGGGMIGPGWVEQKLLLMEMFLPHPFGDDLRQPHLYQKAAWETLTYPGALGLILTSALILRLAWTPVARLLSMLREGIGDPRVEQSVDSPRITARQITPVAIIAIGVYLSLGGWLPGFGSFRETIKARAIVALGIAWAAAVECDWLFQQARASVRNVVLYLFTCVGLAVFALSMYYTVAQPGWFLALLKEFPTPLDPTASAFYYRVLQDPSVGIRTFQGAALWMAAVSAVAGVLIVISRTGNGLLQKLALSAMLLVGCADLLGSHAHAFYSQHPYDAVELEAELRHCLEPLARTSRETGEIPWRLTMLSNIINKTHHIDGLYETGGYDPLMPANANGRSVIDADSTTLTQTTFLHRITGRKWDCSGAYKVADVQSTCGPCAMIVPSAQLVDIERNVVVGIPARAHTFGPNEDNLNFVGNGTSEWLLDGPPTISDADRAAVEKLARLPGAPDGHGTVTGESLHAKPMIAPHVLTTELDLLAPALLIYRTTWLPGWQVRVDNRKWQQALCANRWMVCTTVDQGKHRVEFRYQPVGLSAGILIAGIAWILIVPMILISALHRPRSRSTAL